MSTSGPTSPVAGPDSSAGAVVPTDAAGGGPIDAAPPRTTSDEVLNRYRAGMRRSRTAYLAVLAIVLAALGVAVGVAWSRGEVANTSLRTAAHPSAQLNLQDASARQHLAWRTGERTASGVPLWVGTVVTFGDHAVRGRNARTGAVSWSYTRADRTLCTAAQAGGITVAVYRLHGLCDQVTGLDTRTGARRWTRTLDKDGKPLSPSADFQVTPSTVLVTTSSVIYALDPLSGLDRWTYDRQGCTIEHAVLGNNGALISQTCGRIDCAKLKFCGPGRQLMLRDGGAGVDDKSETNPDQVKWNLLGNRDLPVSADAAVTAIDPGTRRLAVFDGAKGTALRQITLQPTPVSLADISAVTTDQAEVVYIGGVLYAIDPARTTSQWGRPVTNAATVVSTSPDAPTLSTARITAGDAQGILVIDGDTGRPAQRFAVGAPGPGATVSPLGTGFLVASRRATVAYR